MITRKLFGLGLAIAAALGFYGALNVLTPFMPDFASFTEMYEPPRGAIAVSITRTLLAMVIAAAVLSVLMLLLPLRAGFAGLWRRAPARGWIAAAITAAIQIGMIVGFFIPDRSLIFELSLFNVHGSLVTAIGGGVVEEVVHRGIVILILLRAGWSAPSVVLISAALFAINHMGWISWSDLSIETLFLALSPIWGTFILGLALGFTFLESRCTLWPVIAAHLVINLVIEPWLLLAFL